MYKTYIEISKRKLQNNINNIKNYINKYKKHYLGVVIKGNAYGHGMIEIATILNKDKNVDFFLTASLKEAIYLINNNIKKNIIVLHYLDDNILLAIQNNIHLTVYNYEDILEINKIAYSIKKIAKIHVKIDTGMSRLGFYYKDAINIIKEIKNLKNIKIMGIYTHLSDTADISSEFNIIQLKRFEEIINNLEKEKIKIKYIHALSSSGLYLINQTNKCNLIRIGALAYGIIKSTKLIDQIKINIRPIMKLKTKIIQIKEIPENSFVGYNKTFLTKRKSKIAILPIGYYDGYNRALSNNGLVKIKNQYAPVIGIISMNLIIIDITDIKDIKLNDEVILLDDDNIILTNYTKENLNIIPNEIFSIINNSIKRIIVD